MANTHNISLKQYAACCDSSVKQMMRLIYENGFPYKERAQRKEQTSEDVEKGCDYEKAERDQ